MPPEESSPRITDRAERNAATSFRDHGGGPPVEQEAVTGRPNDLVAGKVTNTSFADRAKARAKGSKAVVAGDTEDKAVGSSERKPRGNR